MTFLAGWFRLLLLSGVVWALSGCVPTAPNQSEEELEYHFLAGKSRIKTLDFKGAVESFERALEVNPQNASAHFELGWLYDQKESDPAAAIYHYNRYLRLKPRASNSEMVRSRVVACKQELAGSVSLSPVTLTLQRDLQQLADQNRQLKEQLLSWQAYAQRLQTLTNRPPAPEPGRPAPSEPSPQTRLSPPPSSGQTGANLVLSAPTSPDRPRTHTVRSGENPTTIARNYGIKVDALLQANPRLNANRLSVGQTLVIPGR